jgi:hypothetical protein
MQNHKGVSLPVPLLDSLIHMMGFDEKGLFGA